MKTLSPEETTVLHLRMPVPKEITAQFYNEYYYHVFCRSVGDVNLFRSNADKYHFLKFYFEFLNDFVETLSYNLLDSHFHFIIRIKTPTQITKNLNTYPEEFLIRTHTNFLSGLCDIHTLVAKQFQRLNIKYTNYFNRNYNRKGHLFDRPFKRKVVEDMGHLIRLFVYVHANELHHKLSLTYEHSKWSSYNEIIGQHPTKVNRNEVLKLFEGTDNFIRIHKEMALDYSDKDFA